MTSRAFKKDDRVRVSKHVIPTGDGTVIRADEWTVSVKMDADGIGYLFSASDLTHLTPSEAPNAAQS